MQSEVDSLNQDLAKHKSEQGHLLEERHAIEQMMVDAQAQHEKELLEIEERKRSALLALEDEKRRLADEFELEKKKLSEDHQDFSQNFGIIGDSVIDYSIYFI